MDTLYYVLAVATVMTFRYLPEVTACSCAMEHPQDAFCNADFVLKAKILSEDTVDDDDGDSGEGFRMPLTRYKMDRNKMEVYKAPKDFSIGQPSYIYTAGGMMSSCSVRLQQNQTYVILGRMYQGMPLISPCGGHKVWSSLSPRMMRGYRFLYNLYCNCSIEVSYFPSRDLYTDPMPDDACVWFIRSDKRSCYRDHGVCKLRHGTCKWSRTWRLTACLKNDDVDNEIPRYPSIRDDVNEVVNAPPRGRPMSTGYRRAGRDNNVIRGMSWEP